MMNFLLMVAFVLFSQLSQLAHANTIENQTAPACDLEALDNSGAYNLSQFKGKVVYVDFWASWCGPCGESFPFMNKLHHDLEAKGLQVIAINLDENVDDARLFLKNKTAEFKIASDINAQCAQKFDVQAMPSTYLIDRKGIVRQIHFGFRTGEAEEFRRKVQALLEE